MKRTFMKHTCIAVLIVFLSACSGEKAAEEQVGTPTGTATFILDRLVGTWGSENGKSFERWTKESGTKYHSIGYALNGTDTTVNERAVIYKEGDTWVFENTVAGQNEGKSVKFVSLFVKENSIQFSNPAHDFPTDINYTLPDNNNVNAFIVGPNKDGGKDTIPFNFKRLN